MFASRRIHRTICGLILGAGLAAAGAAALPQEPPLAVDPLRAELAELAKQVKKFLDGANTNAISVGSFTEVGANQATGGPGIQKVLEEELERLKVRIDPDANFEIKGDFLPARDPESNRLTVRVKSRIFDKSADKTIEFASRSVHGDAAFLPIFGITTILPADKKNVDDEMEQALKKPPTEVAATRISAGPGSPYAIEILVRPKGGGQYKPRNPEVRKSDDRTAKERVFVPITRDEVYAVRVINESPHDAAVTLTIDGINMFAFSDVKDPKTDNALYSHMIIPAKNLKAGAPGFYDIKGWHRTNERSEEFVVTEYAKSAAAELRSTTNIGTITVTFAAA